MPFSSDNCLQTCPYLRLVFENWGTICALDRLLPWPVNRMRITISRNSFFAPGRMPWLFFARSPAPIRIGQPHAQLALSCARLSGLPYIRLHTRPWLKPLSINASGHMRLPKPWAMGCALCFCATDVA